MIVTCELKGDVAEILFCDPSGIQTLSAEFRRQLFSALDTVESAPSRVVVFRATGKTFLAGANLHELASLPPDEAATLTHEAHRLMNRVATLPAVTLAVIQAPCLGGGLELALACDLRIGSQSAKFGTPEVGLGLIPGWGGLTRLATLFGTSRARQFALTGDVIFGDEAARLGLLHEVFPPEQLTDSADRYVARLLSRGPEAQRRIKQLLAEFDADLQRRWLTGEAEQFVTVLNSNESAEGIQAFLEKRPPLWNVPRDPE